MRIDWMWLAAGAIAGIAAAKFGLLKKVGLDG